MSEIFIWLGALVALVAISVGVIFGLAALGLLHNQVVGGFVGMGLGVLCLFGAVVAMDWLA